MLKMRRKKILKHVLNYQIQNGIFSFPNNITEIGSYAFCDCKSLKEIVVPESVTEICEDAFDHCNSLQSVEIMNPDAVIMDLHPFFSLQIQ